MEIKTKTEYTVESNRLPREFNNFKIIQISDLHSKQFGENWAKVLDERNISYVAWNISNSKGSASIFKQGSTDMTDMSDENLKEWGIYLKNWYRSKSGLDKLATE